jgi:DNA-binding NtrC family response regulator
MADMLIIDDDPQIRRLLTRILQGAGHSIRTAENGRDGIALFRQQHPALVITDILMPDMEGIETIRAMRAESPSMPIIAISGGGVPSYLRAATMLGATASLAKPFVAAELLSLVAALLEPTVALLSPH